MLSAYPSRLSFELCLPPDASAPGATCSAPARGMRTTLAEGSAPHGNQVDLGGKLVGHCVALFNFGRQLGGLAGTAGLATYLEHQTAHSILPRIGKPRAGIAAGDGGRGARRAQLQPGRDVIRRVVATPILLSIKLVQARFAGQGKH